jgi:membrane protease YdiL (CAAX protease family)
VIAQAATEPTPLLTYAVCVTGLVPLVYLIWRQRAGRPVLQTNPAAFARANPIVLGLIALGYFLFYGLAWAAVLTDDLSPTAALGGGLATLAGALVLYVVVVRRLFRPQDRQAERIRRGFLVLWAAMPVVFGAFLLLQWVGLEGAQKSVTWLVERRHGWQVVALHAVFVAPVAEETCFRGLLYPALRQIRGPRYAILLTAVVFGLVHVPPLAVVLPMVLFGAALAWMCETNGSFLPCLLAHIAFNGLTVLQLLLI